MTTKKPPSSSAGVSQRMRKQATRNTGTELQLRRTLHALGLRYRLHQRLLPGSRREVDIVFTKAKVAIFVDGCFWHSCPDHGSIPNSNSHWWEDKLYENRRRDERTDMDLAEAGWTVARVWEHENPTHAAARIHRLVTSPGQCDTELSRDRRGPAR